MRKIFERIACGLVLTLVPGASLAQSDAPIVTKTGQIGTPPAGKAQIVFFRPGSIVGMALGCTVHENDHEVARLGSGKY